MAGNAGRQEQNKKRPQLCRRMLFGRVQHPLVAQDCDGIIKVTYMTLLYNPVTGLVLGIVSAFLSVWLFRYWPTKSLMPKVLLTPLLSLTIYYLLTYQIEWWLLSFVFIPVGPITAFLAPIFIFLHRNKTSTLDNPSSTNKIFKPIIMFLVILLTLFLAYFVWIIFVVDKHGF